MTRMAILSTITRTLTPPPTAITTSGVFNRNDNMSFEVSVRRIKIYDIVRYYLIF